MELKTPYSEPTVMLRLQHLDGRTSHATVIPIGNSAPAVWFICEAPASNPADARLAETASNDHMRPTSLRRAAVAWIALAFLMSSPVGAQTLVERAREHARRYPGVPFDLPAAPAEFWPTTIEALTKKSEVVLVARLNRMNSYLNLDRVLTDYSIREERVIAGSLPARMAQTPGAVVVALILTVWGGEVTVDGLRISGSDSNREPIKHGGQYLLFLMKSRRQEAGRYEIYYGGIFEVVADKVRPLFKQAENVFKGVGGTPVEDLIQQIENASHSPARAKSDLIPAPRRTVKAERFPSRRRCAHCSKRSTRRPND